MKQIHILWVDDEIDLLQPHILFLREKGYRVDTATNGEDAIRLAGTHNFDLIFLDEHMPGLSGLETMTQIKTLNAGLPIVMITKSEEEDIMDEAIGGKIDDFLIKPVNPKQILLTIKKNIDTKRLVTEKTTSAYQSEFAGIGMLINTAYQFEDWVEIYRKLTYWELELENSESTGMEEVLTLQKTEANKGFARFIKSNYFSWFEEDNKDRPLMSPGIFPAKVFPLTDRGEPVCVVLIDNLRLDQWRTILPVIEEFYRLQDEHLFCSILPTATQYARNAMFAGLMPMEIEEILPDLWVKEEEEGGKNLREEELLHSQIQRRGKSCRYSYDKISNSRTAKKLVDNIGNLQHFDLNVIIFNFVDILSHARTEIEMIRELANDEPAYRSLTRSWFEHSHLKDLLRQLSRMKRKLIITTDHGTIRVSNPVKVVGDRKTSTNLRYKQGRNLNYDPEQVFVVRHPEQIHLPKSNISTTYIFSSNNDFLIYPNNYNHFVNYYRNSLQHGGISMEEMLIPVAVLEPLT